MQLPTFANTSKNMIMKYLVIIIIVSGTIIFTSCTGGGNDKISDVDTNVAKLATRNIAFTIVAQYPHDTSAFTEGLQVYKGKLYEGTGMEHESTLRISDLKTGKVEKKHFYTDPKIFGEGINVFKGKIYQLTWKNHIVFVYDEKNIDQPVKTLTWPYEGWGMTNNGTNLIISDGSANLYFVNPDDFKVKSTIAVTDNSGPIPQLNELEYNDGSLLANVWGSNYILKIDPSSGHVIGKVDFGELRDKYFPNQIIPERTDVLNGIAYDSATKKIYITGKRWPMLFEVSLN